MNHPSWGFFMMSKDKKETNWSVAATLQNIHQRQGYYLFTFQFHYTTALQAQNNPKLTT